MLPVLAKLLGEQGKEIRAAALAALEVAYKFEGEGEGQGQGAHAGLCLCHAPPTPHVC